MMSCLSACVSVCHFCAYGVAVVGCCASCCCPNPSVGCFAVEEMGKAFRGIDVGRPALFRIEGPLLQKDHSTKYLLCCFLLTFLFFLFMYFELRSLLPSLLPTSTTRGPCLGTCLGTLAPRHLDKLFVREIKTGPARVPRPGRPVMYYYH